MPKFLDRPQWNDNGTYRDSAKVTLNGSINQSPSFYAPVSAGARGQFLKSEGMSAPVWGDIEFPYTFVSGSVSGNTISFNFNGNIECHFLCLFADVYLKGNKSSYANKKLAYTGIGCNISTYRYVINVEGYHTNETFTNVQGGTGDLRYNGSNGLNFSLSFQGTYNAETFAPYTGSLYIYPIG